jgi:Ca-activated chloride channel family protein
VIAELLSLELAWPWLLLALPLPWLVARWMPPAPSALDSALRVPFAAEVDALGRAGAKSRRSRSSILWWLVWCLLCLAAARPQELGSVQQPPAEGRDLLLAVDLSGSMAAEDMRLGGRVVDRLTAVKAVLADFLDRRAGDRVGLLLFGERAYAVTPLTLDRNSVRAQLLDSVVGLAGQETAIGDAIALAVKRLGDPDESAGNSGERVVILLTDGVNTAGAITPDRAAQLAQSESVRVHTIGFGGSGSENFFGIRMQRPAQIDEAALRGVADATGGRYFRARDTAELAGIYAELDRIEPTARPGDAVQPRIERYAWPLALALLLAALAVAMQLWSGRTSAWT